MTTSPLSYGPFITRAQAKAQGVKHYFTGKPCKNGHFASRTVAKQACTACVSLQNKRHWQKLKKAAESHGGPVRSKQSSKYVIAWRKRNPEKYAASLRLYRQRKRAKGPEYALKQALRLRLWHALQAAKQGKTKSVLDLVGCSLNELVQHLESLFTTGMSWDNYGNAGWHVDHIRPCSSFENPEDPALWHFSNLQPLWAEDNIRKSDKWEPMAA